MAKKPMTYNGSRKHILDLTHRPDFLVRLNGILEPYNVVLSDSETIQPNGYRSVSEYELQFFIDKHNLKQLFPNLANFNFNSWWNPYGGKAPTWDLLSLCKIDGKVGILLVEAKAHVGEFPKHGKRLEPLCSTESTNNHNNIGTRISDVCFNLNQKQEGFAISINRHYQLSNRVTFASQLATLNVPTCLLYLGFTGDTYFNDHFRDGKHWNREFSSYTENLISPAFINNSGSEFLFISSSLAI